MVAVIDDVVAEVLQSNVPVAVVDKVEVLSQLSTSVTVGVAGVAFTVIVAVAFTALQPPAADIW